MTIPLLYQNTQTKRFGITISEVRKAMPSVSIPYGTERVGVFVSYVQTVAPTTTWNQNVVEGPPVDGKQQWIVSDVDAATYQRRWTAHVSLLSGTRETLLRQSEWTQLPDSLNETERARWAEYRTALRQIDVNNGIVIWPTVPSAL